MKKSPLFKPCLVIPNYNHKDPIRGLLESLEYLGLPCFLVDDGSNEETKTVLKQINKDFSWVQVIHRPTNGGKGAAVSDGLITAYQQGFSHAVQIDADAQHNPQDVPKFLQAAEESPEALVLGTPVFDESVPKARLYGRKITHFWVWVETLSFAIHDALFGFRCYPLATTAKLLQKRNLGKRMDFDPEIAVRLCWEGLPIINIPTQVKYQQGGLSHFHMLKDNLLIAWAHTLLVTEMCLRIPIFILRKLK